jgi:two-component system, NarL family, response regulator DevR
MRLPDRRNKSVLIVEDNAIFRQCLSALLLKRLPGLSVIEDPDGRNVLAEVGDLKPAMVLMDIRLPGRSGLELTKMIKAKHPETFVAIMTSSAEPEYVRASAASGADRFFVKAFMDDEMIVNLINEAIGAIDTEPGRTVERRSHNNVAQAVSNTEAPLAANS